MWKLKQTKKCGWKMVSKMTFFFLKCERINKTQFGFTPPCSGKAGSVLFWWKEDFFVFWLWLFHLVLLAFRFFSLSSNWPFDLTNGIEIQSIFSILILFHLVSEWMCHPPQHNLGILDPYFSCDLYPINFCVYSQLLHCCFEDDTFVLSSQQV